MQSTERWSVLPSTRFPRSSQGKRLEGKTLHPKASIYSRAGGVTEYFGQSLTKAWTTGLPTR